MSVRRESVDNEPTHDDCHSTDPQQRAAAHHLDMSMSSNTAASLNRSQFPASRTYNNEVLHYATMTRHLPDRKAPRSPRGHSDCDVLSRSRAGSLPTSAGAMSNTDVLERVITHGSVIDEASDSEDDDNASDYVLYNPEQDAASRPPLAAAAAAAGACTIDCNSTRPRLRSDGAFSHQQQQAKLLVTQRSIYHSSVI